jgi:hypothetical protein
MAKEVREEKAKPEAAKEEEIRAEKVTAEEAKAEEVKVHDITLSMAKAPPPEVDAGAFIALQGRVSCSSACDLRGKIVKIIAQDAVEVKEIRLVTFYGGAYETDRIVIKAPITPGEYTWTAVFPAQEKEGVLHQESSAPFSFTVKPHHATSMAVWDVPSPIAVGDRFRMKVGVKCSADCKLTDKQIEIYDHEGGKVATEKLGDVPWPGTGTLYWAEVELKSPGTEGYYTWEARFPEPDLELPHEEASHTFGFRTGEPPEHVVTVEVIDKDTKTPIKNADVLLHPYRGYTDERGMARLMVPKDKYELYVSKNEYETFQRTVKAANDVAIKAELLVAPVPDESG